MAFGVTVTGFIPKRLETIKKEIEDTLRGTLGSNVNIDPRGPLGQIIGIFSERESLIWEMAEQVYNSQFPQTSEGSGVDNALSLVGLVRKNPTKSTVTLKYFGAVGTIIPIAHQVRKASDPTVIFETLLTGTILTGTGTNEIQKIVFSAVPTSGNWQIDFDGQLTNTLAFNISAAQLKTELENLANIATVTVLGTFLAGFTVEFTGVDGQKDQVQMLVINNALLNGANSVTATPSTQQAGILPNVSLAATATVTGPVVAPANTLTVSVAPIVGVASVTNPLDAELGTNLESDSVAKSRRNESLAFPGHSTIPAILAEILQLDGVVAARGFENTSMIVDTRGRPAKSYEIIIQGGLNAAIKDVMFATKPAGIQQFGTTTENIIDSQGFAQVVKFSRPSAIPIYLIIDLVTNAQYPGDGNTQVKAALVAYGEGLNIGEDVIVVPSLIVALGTIPGILDINIRIGVTMIPISGSANITFSNLAGDYAVNHAAHGLTEGDRIKLLTTGTLPSGLAPNTIYWVRFVSANQYKLSTTRIGDQIDFVNVGTGIHSSSYGGLEDNIDIDETERADFDTSRITVNI